MSLAIQPPNSQDYLEWQAKHQAELATKYAEQSIGHAQRSAMALYAMYDACYELFTMGVHKERGLSWEAYFTDITGMNGSRYYQIKRVRDLARIIYDETGEIALEYQLRQFPRDIAQKREKTAILQVYDVAKKAMQQGDKKPYDTAQEVISEIQATLIPAPESDTDKIVNHVIEQVLHERTLRRNEHIQSGSNWETVRKSYLSMGYRRRQRAHVRARRNETMLLIERRRKEN